MKHAEWKENVRLALLCAIEKRKGGEIAHDLNIPRSSIHSFAKQGVAGPDTVQSISLWLTSHGYLEGAAPVEPDKPPDDAIINAMATDLEALAAQLRAPIAKATKARLFAERVTFWYRSMEEYLRKVKGGT